MIRPRLFIGLLAIALTALVVTGCARKGDPEPKDPSEFPRQMPKPVGS
ncbi:MAG: hypothetical protein QNJ92_03245 [Alphaproteobacteria bacterium]|nr:hypothetical protein [Alphaproteobacteria bacterium]